MTNKQDVNNQKLELYEYARKKELTIHDIIETEISSQKDPLTRRIDELLSKLSDGDTIIITEISRLGRSTSEVIHLINEIIKRKIRIISIKQELDLNKYNS